MLLLIDREGEAVVAGSLQAKTVDGYGDRHESRITPAKIRGRPHSKHAFNAQGLYVPIRIDESERDFVILLILVERHLDYSDKCQWAGRGGILRIVQARPTQTAELSRGADGSSFDDDSSIGHANLIAGKQRRQYPGDQPMALLRWRSGSAGGGSETGLIRSL